MPTFPITAQFPTMLTIYIHTHGHTLSLALSHTLTLLGTTFTINIFPLCAKFLHSIKKYKDRSAVFNASLFSKMYHLFDMQYTFRHNYAMYRH